MPLLFNLKMRPSKYYLLKVLLFKLGKNDSLLHIYLVNEVADCSRFCLVK